MTARPFQLYRELTALRHIKRFQQHGTVAPISVAEHSFYVAMLAGTFARQLTQLGVMGARASVVTELGLWHDAAEAMMGDVPHQVKRLSDALHDEWARIEEGAIRQLLQLAGVPNGHDATKLEELLVKAADWIELVLYGFEERTHGNRGIDRAVTRIWALLEGVLMEQMTQHGRVVTAWYEDLLDGLHQAEYAAQHDVRGLPLLGEQKP